MKPDERAERAELMPLEYDVQAKRTLAWTNVERLGLTAQNEAIQLAAWREYLKRTDPEPTRPLIEAKFTGPSVIVWDLSAPEIPPVSERKALKSSFSSGSSASTSSSAIADGERPPSASTG